MKIAIVTGANSGIGQATTRQLLQMGYKVYGLRRSAATITHENFVAIQIDLSDFESYPKILEYVTEDNIDVLCNNAGVAFERMALDEDRLSIQKTFDINFFAPILLTKLLKQKLSGGLVINTSSVSDRLVGEEYATYCSSKAALNVYFQTIALEEKELKNLSVLPSYVDTPLLRRLQENNKEFDWNMPIKPEEVSKFICSLIQDNSKFETGAKIIVVNNALKEDLEYDEDLWGYNVSTEELSRLKQ